MCSHLFSPLLTSSELFSHLLSWSQLLSAHLISALLSALSNHLTFSLAQNLLQKRILAPKQATPTLSTEKIWHREAFTQGSSYRSLYTQKLSHTASLYTASFYIEKPFHREAFTQRSFYTQQTFTHRSFYTQPAFTLSQKLFHREAFTLRSFYKEKILHTASF